MQAFFSYEDYLKSFNRVNAATTIQKNVRGFITRRYLAKLRNAAIIIQKIWRAYHAKIVVRNKVLHVRLITEEKKKSLMAKNKKMASNILTKENRLYNTVQVITSSLQHPEQIKLVNNSLVLKMRRNLQCQLIEQYEEIMSDKIDWLNYTLLRLHHLIRTIFIPGIYSSKDNGPQRSTLDKMLADNIFCELKKELIEENKITKCYKTIALNNNINYNVVGIFRMDEVELKIINISNNPK